MQLLAPNRDIVVRLAGWTESILGSSMVLATAIVLLGISLVNASEWVAAHPIGAILAGLFFSSYAISFVCLRQVRKRGGRESMSLWLVSAAAACVPLIIIAVLIGFNGAVLILGMAEVAAIVCHIAAISIILRRSTSTLSGEQ